MEAIATHHFIIKSKSANFVAEVSGLKPYSIVEGNWFVHVLFVSGQIENSESPLFLITSENVTTQNEKNIILANFCFREYETNKNGLVFNSGINALTAHRITHATDKLQFKIQTLEEQDAKVLSELTLGIALVQFRV